MEIKGTIKVLGEIQQITQKFKKREIVIEDNLGQYSNFIACQLTQDKCDLGNDFAVGDNVIAGINLRGREWINPEGQAKYFNSIEIWRMEKEVAVQNNNKASGIAKQFQEEAIKDLQRDDDMPF